MNLIDLGWDQNFKDKFEEIEAKKSYGVARVAVEKCKWEILE